MTSIVRPETTAANTTVFDDDASIPILTERLTLPALDLDIALPPTEEAPAVAPPLPNHTLAPAAEAPFAHAAPAAPEAPPLPTAEQLQDAVLKAVLDRLPEEINTLVRQLLRPAIDAAVAHLSIETNLALRTALTEIVERAVRDALKRAPLPPR